MSGWAGFWLMCGIVYAADKLASAYVKAKRGGA